MLTVLRKGSGLSWKASCILISVVMIKTTYPTWSKALNPLIHDIETIVLKWWTLGNPFFHTAFFGKCLVKPVNVAGLFVESSVSQFLMCKRAQHGCYTRGKISRIKPLPGDTLVLFHQTNAHFRGNVIIQNECISRMSSVLLPEWPKLTSSQH